MKRLLSKNISRSQIAAYIVANLTGLTIILLAVQFYADMRAALGTDSTPTGDYVVIQKPVAAFGAAPTFSEAELADIASQPWAEDMGSFTPAGFAVSAALNMGSHNFSTALFFESVPDRFVDADFGTPFDPEHPEIAIVLPADYLALYNFGFALSQGLPQITSGMISAIPLQVNIAGDNRRITLPARIVGFSDRINTVAVPADFMEWANENFGSRRRDSQPSRIIVKVDNPANPAIASYIEGKGFQTAGRSADADRASYIISVTAAGVITIGAIISALAVMVLFLSLSLLLERNRTMLRKLMIIGWAPGAICRFYYKPVAAANVVVTIGAVAAMLAVRSLWLPLLSDFGIPATSPWPGIAVAAAFLLIVTAANFRLIRTRVTSHFHPGK